MSKYRAVIFDLDGTLLNTIDDLAAGVNHVLALHGYPVHSVPEVQSMVGNGVARLMSRAQCSRNFANIISATARFIQSRMTA